MHQVMAGVQVDQVTQRLLAPFRMAHHTPQVLGCRPPEQAQIRLPQARPDGDRNGETYATPAQGFHPGRTGCRPGGEKV